MAAEEFGISTPPVTDDDYSYREYMYDFLETPVKESKVSYDPEIADEEYRPVLQSDDLPIKIKTHLHQVVGNENLYNERPREILTDIDSYRDYFLEEPNIKYSEEIKISLKSDDEEPVLNVKKSEDKISYGDCDSEDVLKILKVPVGSENKFTYQRYYLDDPSINDSDENFKNTIDKGTYKQYSFQSISKDYGIEEDNISPTRSEEDNISPTRSFLYKSVTEETSAKTPEVFNNDEYSYTEPILRESVELMGDVYEGEYLIRDNIIQNQEEDDDIDEDLSPEKYMLERSEVEKLIDTEIPQEPIDDDILPILKTAKPPSKSMIDKGTMYVRFHPKVTYSDAYKITVNKSTQAIDLPKTVVDTSTDAMSINEELDQKNTPPMKILYRNDFEIYQMSSTFNSPCPNERPSKVFIPLTKIPSSRKCICAQCKCSSNSPSSSCLAVTVDTNSGMSTEKQRIMRIGGFKPVLPSFEIDKAAEKLKNLCDCVPCLCEDCPILKYLRSNKNFGTRNVKPKLTDFSTSIDSNYDNN